MTMSRRSLRTVTIALLAAGTAFLLAACGSSSSSSDNSSASTTAASTASGGDTVSVASISGVGDVLVDSQGHALYTNNQDSSTNVVCTGECAAIWVPLTLPAGTKAPTGPSDVQSKLGVVTNPDGDQQVTFDGLPLYTFVQDGTKDVSGDGFMDSFGGTSFTWSAATSSGASSKSAKTPSTSSASSTGSTSSSSSGGGGYTY